MTTYRPGTDLGSGNEQQGCIDSTHPFREAVVVTPRTANLPEGASRGDRLAALRAAGWLSVAATPTFAVMALVTGIHGGSMPHMLGSSAGRGLSVSGMSLMYGLMSAFHSGPWLRLISRGSSDCHRSSRMSLCREP